LVLGFFEVFFAAISLNIERKTPDGMESLGPASGWFAVLISLAAAVVLPIITMGIVAFCLPRKRMQTPDEHWTERARSLFPFKAIRILSVSVLPILYACRNAQKTHAASSSL
jgi:hypothetical protein